MTSWGRVALIVIGLAAIACSKSAFAELTVSLTPASQTYTAGAGTVFSATLTNTGASDLFLNDIAIDFTPPGNSFLTADRNLFFASVPGILAPGEIYNGPVFQVTATTAATGTYSGSVTILGGTDIFALGSLGAVNFALNRPQNQPPSVVSAAPINGSGTTQTFTATYSDPNGVFDLDVVHLLFNSSLRPAGACWVYYLPASNTMYLVNDGGSGFVTGTITPGSPGTLSNTQCTIGNAGTVTTGSNNLTVPVAITFATGFTGTKNVYGYALDGAGAISNWITLGTWIPAPGPQNQPPSVVSAAPINGSGTTQTFTATYSDPNGVFDLEVVHLLFNSSLRPAGACWVYYLPASNTMYLVNDGGSGFVTGTITPGSPGTLSNMQCTIGNAGTVTTGSNSLTVPVAITFATGFTGTKNVYGYALDGAGAISDWITLGTWIPAPGPLNQPPSVVSAAPINGSGTMQTFTATYSDPNGVFDLEVVHLLFNSSLRPAGACWVYYLPASNTMYLVNDGGSGFVTGTITPGSPGTLSNTQCTIGNAGTVTTGSNNLTVPVAITFATGFTGTKNVYGYALDGAGAISDWITLGTWIPAPGPQNQPPSVVSAAPINGSGTTQTFTATYSDPNGVFDLEVVHLLFNSSLRPAGACWVYYLPASNTMYLVNDGGSGFVTGTITPGSPGTLSNTQCTIGNAGTVTTGSNNLTVPVAITFDAGFTGTKNVYGYALDGAGAISDWITLGTWTP